MRFFCTSFDRNYLARGLALYRSLRQHGPGFELWALCLDADAFGAVERLALPGLRGIPLEALEVGAPGLRQAREDRSKVEFYFTCTPFLPLHLLRSRPEIDRVTYLDADLFFFASPEPLFGTPGPIQLTEHRFPPALRHLERHGIHNVGWLSFGRESRALECLEGWGAQCLAWCRDRPEEGRFADQKYLDAWPERFPVEILRQKGANLAPWNVANYVLSETPGGLLVDGEPLFFFHFHGFRRLARGLYDPNLARYGSRPSRLLRRAVFRPYVACLAQVTREWTLAGGRGMTASIRGDARQGLLAFGKGLLGGSYLFYPTAP